uniref:3-methylmercaptopropionyl-CoA dehydrogenase n=1 Tax=Caulobacter sp. (strain K31) TaxID=366602 RepID=B0T9K7_CAUSK
MTSFRARLDDYGFLWTVLDLDGLASLPGYEEATRDTVSPILAEAARFAEQVLFPLNRQGDEIGARLDDGVVTTPPGFKAAYAQFAAAGWPALSGPTEFGGQGLPSVLNFALYEMIAAACLSFGHYSALTHGAALALEAHGSPALKATYLEPLVTGRWGGTMCLTESHAGTDLGLIRTRAEPDGEGAFRLTGGKIFITSGEHDLVENIVHLVLARLPGAPAGVKGISLFVVPKFIPRPDGALGERNAVTCGAIEHKMGLKASATCAMNFDGAVGRLVGQPHRGLQAMFTMMNAERLLLSAQGQGVAETAYQSAAAYARDRLQGRAPGDHGEASAHADPIIVHPDVRRMLLTMRAHAEGGRALGLWVMRALDVAARDPDPDARASANALVALMTPIVKVWLSDTASETANLGIQVMGGHGFIREWGMEQLVRDARILQLYEGANGIQALDLVARKLPMENGRLLDRLTAPIEAFIREREDDPLLDEFVNPLRRVLRHLLVAADCIAERGRTDPAEVGAASTDFLKIAGYAALAYLWARMAVATWTVDDQGFAQAKLATARFFFARLLPQASAHLEALQSGAKTLMTLPAEAF